MIPPGEKSAEQSQFNKDGLKDIFAEYPLTEEVADDLFKEVSSRYEAEGRHYHTLGHIVAVLDFLQKYKPEIKDWQAVKLAILFHDIIYDTKSNSNEEDSAEYARQKLEELNIDNKTIDEVRSLILATKTHEVVRGQDDSEIFLDADLSVLGSAERDYNDYAEKIRKEYAWVSEDKFRVGRRKVLEGFLSRPYIYFSESVRAELEEKARKNLQRELEKLN